MATQATWSHNRIRLRRERQRRAGAAAGGGQRSRSTTSCFRIRRARPALPAGARAPRRCVPPTNGITTPMANARSRRTGDAIDALSRVTRCLTMDWVGWSPCATRSAIRSPTATTSKAICSRAAGTELLRRPNTGGLERTPAESRFHYDPSTGQSFASSALFDTFTRRPWAMAGARRRRPMRRTDRSPASRTTTATRRGTSTIPRAGCSRCRIRKRTR